MFLPNPTPHIHRTYTLLRDSESAILLKTHHTILLLVFPDLGLVKEDVERCLVIVNVVADRAGFTIFHFSCPLEQFRVGQQIQFHATTFMLLAIVGPQ